MNTASDFFEVTLVGNVTVIKLLNPDSYRRQDESNAIDPAALIYWLEGSRPPPTLSIWEQFRNDLIAFLETKKPARVVLDFAGLHQIGPQSVISSAMNGVFMMAKKLSDKRDCQWRVCGLTDVTKALYGVSSLHQIFPHTNRNQADAVAAFGTNVQPSA